MENFDKINCIYSRTSPLLDLVTCIWKSTKNMLNDLNAYISFIHSCITFFFLIYLLVIHKCHRQIQSYYHYGGKSSSILVKKNIYMSNLGLIQLHILKTYYFSFSAMYCLMSCFARKLYCQPNSLCNQRNYPKEIEHC